MEILQFLADHRTPFLDSLFQLITYLGEETFVIAIICWLYWCKDKTLAYAIGFTYFVSGLLVQGLKITFRIPRPWVLDPQFQAVPSAIPAATGYSFPSGHTQSGTALYGSLALFTKKKWQSIVAVLIFLLIAFSRMYLGCHTPKDVLTAMLISLAAAFFFHWLFYRKERIFSHDGVTALLLSLCALALMAYTCLLSHIGLLPLIYASDCAKASGAGLAFGLGYYLEHRFLNFSLPDTTKKGVLRLLIGLAVTLCIQGGLKPLLGTSVAAGFGRYFLVVLWILILYPWLFSKRNHFSTGS